MAKTKFFRVMTEGATTDGRKIKRKWIEQMAANYNPEIYGARIWLEHLRGLWPDSEFRAYGDVLAVEARPVEDGKLALFAQFDVTDDLLAINKKRQKIYSSAEVAEDFAETGEAYLVGMAFTDSPASLGTEMLQFSAQAKEHPLASRKQSPDNLFTAATPFTFELEDDMDPKHDNKPATPDGGKNTLLSKIKETLAGDREKQEEQTKKFNEDISETLLEMATSQRQLAEAFADQRKADAETIDALTKQVETLSADLKKVTDDFTALREQLDNEPQGEGRSPAAGGNAKDPDGGF